MSFINIKVLVSIGIVISLVLCGAGIEIWKLNKTLDSVKTELKETENKLALKEAALEISVANVKECNSKIDLQNTKIESLRINKQDEQKVKEKVKEKIKYVKEPLNETFQEKVRFYEDLFSSLSK